MKVQLLFLNGSWRASAVSTHVDPEQPENSGMVALAFITQSADDTRKKLQKQERLGEKSLRDLVQIAESITIERARRKDRLEQEKH